MFTGIVEERGHVLALERAETSARLQVAASLVTRDATPGCSISVSGVCLTVVEHALTELTFDVMAETLQRSSLGALVAGDEVNLERALPAGGRLGGHLVQGHIDDTTTLLRRDPGERWEVLTFATPTPLRGYLAAKGSIALDGVSLTLAKVRPETFSVSLIPTTLAMTTLGQLRVGAQVNVEVDVLAKYVETLLATHLNAQVSR